MVEPAIYLTRWVVLALLADRYTWSYGAAENEWETGGFDPIYRSVGIQSPCQRMIGVYNHLLSRVFRFHYYSQKVIGSLGYRGYSSFYN